MSNTFKTEPDPKFVEIFNSASGKTNSELGEIVLPIDSKDYRFYYFKACYYYFEDRNIISALKEIQVAINLLPESLDKPTILRIRQSFRPNFLDKVYGLAGEIYAANGLEQESLNMYIEYQKLKCCIKNESFKKLYSFRPINEYSLKEIAMNRIVVCHPSVFNDPYDSLILTWADHYRNHSNPKPHWKIFADSYKYYRAKSFISDSNSSQTLSNLLMWSHYADSHKGICIEYQFSDNFTNKSNNIMKFKKIHYSNNVSIDYSKAEINTDLSLLTKAQPWQYENEVKLITYIIDDATFLPIELDKESKIAAIYFGSCCEDENIKFIKSILPYDSINLYQMKSPDETPYMIVPQKI